VEKGTLVRGGAKTVAVAEKELRCGVGQGGRRLRPRNEPRYGGCWERLPDRQWAPFTTAIKSDQMHTQWILHPLQL